MDRLGAPYDSKKIWAFFLSMFVFDKINTVIIGDSFTLIFTQAKVVLHIFHMLIKETSGMV